MYNNKKVLLIAGGGTLGTHTPNELLRLGTCVDVICPEEKVSMHKNLRFIQDYVSKELLEQLFSENYYNSIVNFIHYSNVEEYLNANPLVLNTDWRKIGWQYDRKFSRAIDNSKILQVTGLKKKILYLSMKGLKSNLKNWVLRKNVNKNKKRCEKFATFLFYKLNHY